MSDLTWIILLLVFWRIIIQPLIVGYRSADAHKKATKKKVEYTDYEEIS
ncbi:MAG: hypothetical protein IPL48_03870 [Bacteroidetes bacterium]|nr:hypothetical protein [Bacteroidota bacterium]